MNKTKTTVLILMTIFISSFALISKESKAAQCGTNECKTSEYVCNNDDMCCTGGGCPSWVCKKDGGSWYQPTNTCTKCTTIWKRVCVEYERYIDDYEYKCKSCHCAMGASDTREQSDVLGESIAYIPSDCECCGWYPVYKRKCVDWEKEKIGEHCTTTKADKKDTCRYCSGENNGNNGEPTCTPTAITGKPSLSAPGNGDDLDSTTTTVRLSWTAPSNWGECCESCAQKYEVWVKTNSGAWSKKTTIVGRAYNLTVSEGNTYQWYIRAINGDATALRSDIWSFNVLAEAPRVSGYIWDSTEKACNSSKTANEIKRADLEGNIVASVGGNVGTWNPAAFGSYSYEVTGLSDGNNQTVCASVPAPKDKPNFKYNLACLNNSSNGIISGSCATINISGDTTAHLGFELTSRGWFHVMDGDVYAGCDDCIDSISMGIPDTPLGGYSGYLVDGPGAVFGNSDLSVKNSGGSDRYVTGGNKFYNKNMQSNFWPTTFAFSAPSSAESIVGGSNCRNMLNNNNLEAGKSYSVSRNCMQLAIDNLSGNYKISSNGIAVIYVEADGVSLSFDADFRSQNRNTRRLVIVTEADVDIDSSLGYASPTSSSRPNIEASLILNGSINFLSNGSNDDTTVIIEGPLATKNGSIDFSRDRGLDNGYPAEVVVYNPIYLSAFDAASDTGLGVVDVSWTLY